MITSSLLKMKNHEQKKPRRMKTEENQRKDKPKPDFSDARKRKRGED